MSAPSAPAPSLGRAEWSRDAPALPQGGHSVTGLATVRRPTGMTSMPTTVVAKAVRNNREQPASNRLYRKFLAAEQRCYERLAPLDTDHQYAAPYYGTALINMDDGREETCLCVGPAGISLGRYLLELNRRQEADRSSALRHESGTGVVYADSLRLILEVWEALHFLHTGAGFCHGDVKPSNVVVGRLQHDRDLDRLPARARLIDFGKSFEITGDRGGPHRPATTAYEAATWSPWSVQQYSSAVRRPPDHAGAVDVFGMALLAVDCLTGTTLESVPVHLRETLREAYCSWAPIPDSARQDPSAYAAWAAGVPAGWDRTPVHFLWDWAAANEALVLPPPPQSRSPRRPSPSKPKTKPWVTGTLSRRLARCLRAGPSFVGVLGPMTHPDPSKRPGVAASLAAFRELAKRFT